MHKSQIISNIIIGTLLVALVLLAIPFESVVANAKNEGVYFHGDTTSNKVSLMINVYSGSEYIEPILHALKNEDVKATFFIGGVWASRNADLVKKIFAAGHELGNHGYLHKDSDKISTSRLEQEIKTCHDLVLKLTGYEMSLFAPPSGAYNQQAVQTASSLGYKTIMWTLDTIDWRDKSIELVYKRATKTLNGGNLILMHPTNHTVAALPQIISTYKNAGFQLTCVGENILANV